jgi:hypothetical protein
MNHTQPIGRLRLEPLEDRTVPTGSEGIIGPVPVPTYSVGAGAGGLPIAKLYDTVGNLVREVIAFDPSFRGGVRVATADINGDLIKDTIAAPGPGMPPEIRVFSGANGALIRQFFAYAPAFTGGVFVAAGDVNGDGRADIITGPGAGGGPHVQAFSGVNNALLTSIIAYDPNFRGGVSVGAGNVAGGFLAQIITGAGVGGGPHVRVFDGLNGAPLSSFFAFEQSTRFGVNVAALPGSTFGVTAIVTAFGPGGPPQVRVFNSPQAIAADFFAYDVNFLGGVNVGAAPAGAFGANAILTGAGAGGGPHVKVLQIGAAPPPALIQNFFAFDAAFLGGVYVG